jgi:hypothetical protein
LLAGCASGRSAFDPPDAGGGGGGPDAKVWRDGAIIEPQVDAHVVVVPADAPAVQPACHDQQLLSNPVLDLNPSGMGWVQQNIDNQYPIITGDDGIAEHSPPFKAWLGGLEAFDYGVFSVTDVLYQDVTIPANTTQVRLTGVYEVRTTEVATTAYDTAQLALTRTDGTPLQIVKTLSNLTPTTAWTAIDTLAPANLAGQTVRLRITTTNDVIDVTSFYFDTLALTATICPEALPRATAASGGHVRSRRIRRAGVRSSAACVHRVRAQP